MAGLGAVTLLSLTAIGIIAYTAYLCSGLDILIASGIILIVSMIVVMALFSAITRLAGESEETKEKNMAETSESGRQER